MAEKETEKTEAEAGKVAVKTGAEKVPSAFEEAWHPLLSLRREMDRVFDDFFTEYIGCSRSAMDPFGQPALLMTENAGDFVRHRTTSDANQADTPSARLPNDLLVGT